MMVGEVEVKERPRPSPDYLMQLLNEKKLMTSLPNLCGIFTHLERLLDEGKGPGRGKRPRCGPISARLRWASMLQRDPSRRVFAIQACLTKNCDAFLSAAPSRRDFSLVGVFYALSPILAQALIGEAYSTNHGRDTSSSSLNPPQKSEVYKRFHSTSPNFTLPIVLRVCDESHPRAETFPGELSAFGGQTVHCGACVGN
ncbi:hypothetical protein NQZ68_017451 [Dissostichus eleginoides]|nr:hypothetical protein NQZ68_017451 [Dissostichus eleginoides]